RSLLAAPGWRAELARGAVTHARGLSWDRTAQRLLAVYREAVAANRARLSQLVGS
ncbi:MAG TPA: D-inositol-3-phosphate glycosyltransferase, partial [Natronosporangium sp.]|nr:D-inositol-3-phosphate glycosyltransferase [Natronosporangium sp.]